MSARFTLISAFLAVSTLISSAATPATVSLPAPDTSGGSPFCRAVAQRHSTRAFNPDAQISADTLSTLLWAAAGVNRPADGKRTNPTAMNRQEISVYLFNAEGVWLYDSAANTLLLKAEGDHRRLVAGSQEFVMQAPVSLVMVADLSLLGDPAKQRTLMMGCCDTGIVSENINLCCSALGLATVPRASMDAEGISRLLGLSPSQIPVLNNPVGHAL